MNWTQLHWQRPEAAWGFAAVALAAAALVWLAYWRSRVRRAVGDDALVEAMTASVSRTRRGVRVGLLLAALALLTTAAMRPQYGLREGSVANVGIDLAIALDLSKSMKVKDVVPDRLTAAKLDIEHLLDRLAGGRVALIPFTAVPFIQSPLTSDFGAIVSFLRNLDVTTLPVGGTSIARGIAKALDALTGQDVEGSDGKVRQFEGSKYKAIVVFSDGEDHEGGIDKVIERAKDAGIRIFTVGVGTGPGNVVPVLSDDGSVVGYMKGPDGKTPLISGLNEPLLRRIAEQTGGRYFHLASQSVADALYAEIDKLEKKEFEAKFLQLREERYQYVLFAAFLFLLAEWLIGDRRRTRRRWFGRPRANVAAALLAGVALAAVGGAPRAQAGDVRDDTGQTAGQTTKAPTAVTDSVRPLRSLRWYETTDGDVDRAAEALAAGKAADALAALDEARKHLPESWALHYDRGIALLAAGQFEKATKAFERALEMSPGRSWRTRVRYALGVAWAKWAEATEKANPDDDAAQDRWKAAAKAFEEVVAADPSNEDAKWNLEVALLRVDPPCKLRDEAFEPNDSPDKAQELKLGQAKDGSQKLEGDAALTLCPGDNDWLAVNVPPGTRIAARAEVAWPPEDDEDDDSGDLEAQATGHPPAGVALALTGPTGKDVLAAATDDGRGTVELPERKATSKGPYLLHLTGLPDDEVTATLHIEARPPCTSLEDDMEDNDTPQKAVPLLEPEPLDAQICPNDPDWYAVDLAPGESLFVFASAKGDHAKGFALTIADASGVPLARGSVQGPDRIATLLDPAPGRYTIRVSGGDETEAPYVLQWRKLPPCPEGNDQLEPNEAVHEAATLDEIRAVAGMSKRQRKAGAPQGPGAGQDEGEVTALLRICPGDNDVFDIPVAKDDHKVASIVFDPKRAQLVLERLDEQGKVVETAKANAEVAGARGLALEGGDKDQAEYLLRVHGQRRTDENFYVLRLLTPPPPKAGGKQQAKNDQKKDGKKKKDEKKDRQQQAKNKQDEGKNENAKRSQAPIEDMLRDLEKNPDNLQARQALRRSPLRNWRPEKDW